jgi:hypothetical protein
MEEYSSINPQTSETAWQRYKAERAVAREKRRERRLENARHSYFGALYLSMIGRSAMHRVAVASETDPVVIRRRENELVYRWKRFVRGSFKGPTPSI